MNDKVVKIEQIFSERGIKVENAEKFLLYFDELVETNEKMNLTAITEFDEVIKKHFLDSLMLFSPLLSVKETGEIFGSGPVKMLDVGTGAGFPGVPLKLLKPETSLYLLDALEKRLHFLEGLSEKLGLSDVHTIHGRTEDLGHEKGLRENFEIVTSRAVAGLPVLLEYCLPFVKENGYFIAYKSGNVDEETEESEETLSILGGEIANVYRYTLPGGDERSLLFIKKIRITPEKYPRNPKKIKKSPL